MCKDKERNKKREEGKIVINNNDNNNNKVTSTIAKDGENDENYLRNFLIFNQIER